MTPGLPVAAEELVLWHRNYQSEPVRALVQMALDKTPEYPDLTLVASKPMGQGRALRELREGRRSKVAVANVATSPEREDQLLPIALPFDRGLLGYRVCLIREGNQAHFDGIDSVASFNRRGLLIGQGRHWPDRIILQSNGLNVVTAAHFQNLFAMLRRSRFDCFLRGAGEVLIDLQQQDTKGLTVERNLLFRYDMPSYLFVGPDNTQLALRLELGIRRAMESNDFNDYFNRYFRPAIVELRLYERQTIRLENPYLSAEGEVDLPMMPLKRENLPPFPATRETQ
ncbi:MAG: hypothetical protein R3296_05300 [Oleiphilaceae bacterium]|nr:hypothetical protein [Oleiphilaceae bacterium]